MLRPLLSLPRCVPSENRNLEARKRYAQTDAPLTTTQPCVADRARVIVAVPVCAAQTAVTLRREVDDVVCLGEYEDFHAVGLYYEDFAPVPDAEVRELIARSRHAPLGR